MLTSAGLLALLPYILKQGWRKGDEPFLFGFSSAPIATAADANNGLSFKPGSRSGVLNEDVEELMAHLFSLRMTVSEIAAEVQDANDAFESETRDDDTQRYGSEESLNRATEVA